MDLFRSKKLLEAHLVYKLALLIRAPKLEELLDDIVAEHIGHQAVGRGQDLLEDQLLVGRVGPLQLLLGGTRPVLVLGKLDHVVGQVSELHVRVPVVPANDKIDEDLYLNYSTEIKIYSYALP